MNPRRRSDLLWMVGPTIAILGLFVVYPVIAAVRSSFQSWDLLTPPREVGLANYQALAADGTLWETALRTLLFAGLVVAGAVSVGLVLALALNRTGRLAGFIRGAIFSAYVISWVAVALLWMWILDGGSGVAGTVLRSFGVEKTALLSRQDTALPALAFVTIWKIAGYAMVIFLAGLQSIPQSLYEAAALDGAGRYRTFFYITWPSLRPTTVFVATTSLIMSFQAFDVVRVMTQGGPVKATTLFVYAIYEEVFINLRVGRANALTVAFVVMLGLLLLIQSRLRGARAHG
jgi:ABC-type sugar transport system permease subunit